MHALKHKSTCGHTHLNCSRIARRLRGVNTQIAEQTFSWFRIHARVLNEKRAHRHHFLVLQYCKKHNLMMDSGDTSHLNAFSAVSFGRRSVSYPC